MLTTLWAIVRNGKIELLEGSGLPEGAKVLVTPVPDDDSQFWANELSLDAIWDNSEDDVYAELLKE